MHHTTVLMYYADEDGGERRAAAQIPGRGERRETKLVVLWSVHREGLPHCLVQ